LIHYTKTLKGAGQIQGGANAPPPPPERNPGYYILATRMADGHIKEFDSAKETIEDFRQCFEFYCMANNIKAEDEPQQAQKKALFITMLGQATFVKLRDLTSPDDIKTLTLEQVMALLTAHFQPQTIEIAERYKFFTRIQEYQESTMDFIAALRRLAKTCNFGQYLDIPLCDQFVCGLSDRKCQREPDESTAAHEVVPFVPLEVESSARDSHGQELVTLRPMRNRHPPARLIEEMT